MKEKPFVVACVPAYNEERTIAGIILQAQKYVDKVIVCDDGSSDLTGGIAERLGAEVVRHDINMGYGAALRTLFERARELSADVMVTLDADGQHDPDDVPEIVKPLLDGKADIVIGSRFLDGESKNSIPSYRRNGIRLITNVTKIASCNNITDAQSGYRAYGRRALSLIDPTEYGMGASTEILLKAKDHALRVAEVPVNISYDKDSNGRNPFAHGLDVALSTVKHLSIKRPLLFYGVPGILAFMSAMGFWILCLQYFAATRSLPTNIALVAVFLTVAGLILLTTSIILWVLITVLREKL